VASVSVKHDIAKLERRLRRWPKQIAFAKATALTSTAWDAKRAVDRQIPQKLDRPTPFTQKAVFVDRATKSKPRAIVGIRPNRWKYLRWVIEGGSKRPDRRALVAPVGVKLNRYGNMPRTAVKRALAKRSKTGHGSTFSGKPRGHASANPGIYERVGRGKAGGRTQLRLLVGYRPRANYRPDRLPFGTIVRGVVRNRMGRNIERAVARALETRR
jgi:hypothetical protein